LQVPGDYGWVIAEVFAANPPSGGFFIPRKRLKNIFTFFSKNQTDSPPLRRRGRRRRVVLLSCVQPLLPAPRSF
jgi:hypothetical protein